MSKDKKKPIGSSIPISAMSTKPSRIPGEKVLEELDTALEAGDNLRVLELLDAAPTWMKKQPEIMLVRATVLMSLGKDHESFNILREMERKYPRFTELQLPLSMFYMDQGWSALALQAGKCALSDSNLTKEDRASLDELIKEATAFVQDHAAEFGLSFETMQRACIFYEQALMAIDAEKLSEVERLSKEAVKIAPNWNPPHNIHAFALNFLGKTSEAITESEAVLVREAENVFALRNLVTYHLGLDQSKKAQEYADRLKELSENYSPDGQEIEEIIIALALVEDTPALWKIAQRYFAEPSVTLFGRSWQCLAVAAIRSGKWKDALRLMKKAEKEELTPSGKKLLDELEEGAVLDSPRLAWMPPAYPGVDQLLHPKVIAEWDALLKNFNEPLSPSQKRKLDVFLQKFPFMRVVIKRLLFEEDTYEITLEVLLVLETPEMDGEILRFALSKSGNQAARLKAILAFIQTGRYIGPKIVKMWDEDQEEWREVELNTQRIGNIKVNAQPQTLALIERANKTKNLQDGIALLRKAIEMEPTSPIAIFNLGVTLCQSGKTEEGETLIFRSVEVDPNYMYGHASIALTEAGREHKRVALDHLEMVTHADIIASDTAVVANMAWTTLALLSHDLVSARQRLDMAIRIDPDHPLLERYEKMLKEAEDVDERFYTGNPLPQLGEEE